MRIEPKFMDLKQLIELPDHPPTIERMSMSKKKKKKKGSKSILPGAKLHLVRMFLVTPGALQEQEFECTEQKRKQW